MAISSENEKERACSVPGCSEPHHAKGFCQKHYDQHRKKNRSSSSSSSRKTCCVPGCNRFHHARGYCKMHYAKLSKKGEEETKLPSTPVKLPPAEEDEEAFRQKRLVLIRQRHRTQQKRMDKAK